MRLHLPGCLWRCLHTLRSCACYFSHIARLQLSKHLCSCPCERDTSLLPQVAHPQRLLFSLHFPPPDHPRLLLQAAETMTLCPPPVDLIFPDRLQFMQTLILTVADRLGLAGLAQVAVPACYLWSHLCCASMLAAGNQSVLMG